MKRRIPTINPKDILRLAIPIFDIAIEHPEYSITFTACACCGAVGRYTIDTSQGGDSVVEMGFFNLADFLIDFSKHDTAGVNIRCEFADGTSDVFGFFMAGGGIHLVDAEKVKWAHTHRADTLEYIGEEDGTNYTDYRSFRAKNDTITDAEVEDIIAQWDTGSKKTHRKRKK